MLIAVLNSGDPGALFAALVFFERRSLISIIPSRYVCVGPNKKAQPLGCASSKNFLTATTAVAA